MNKLLRETVHLPFIIDSWGNIAGRYWEFFLEERFKKQIKNLSSRSVRSLGFRFKRFWKENPNLIGKVRIVVRWTPRITLVKEAK